jgi:hypothetical protein
VENNVKNRVAVEIVASKGALERPRTAGIARLWVGEVEGKIQTAFDPPQDGLALTAEADKAAVAFHDAYVMQALMNNDDSVESQIRATRRFWAELLACAESWKDEAPGGGSE